MRQIAVFIFAMAFMALLNSFVVAAPPPRWGRKGPVVAAGLLVAMWAGILMPEILRSHDPNRLSVAPLVGLLTVVWGGAPAVGVVHFRRVVDHPDYLTQVWRGVMAFAVGMAAWLLLGGLLMVTGVVHLT